MEPVRIGVLGCGNISGIYFSNLRQYAEVKVIACADLNEQKAREAAAEYEVPCACTPDELLAMSEVDLVLNLTIPVAHTEVNLAAIEAGKHVYAEKPLGITREEGIRQSEAANQAGVLVGCAPDTVLGAGIQTARRLIDRGEIGDIVAGQGFMLGRGVETWHPNPDFYYQPGGGPMLDMGPYYLSAMITLMGPIAAVSAMTRTTFPTRLISSEPFAGKTITVRTPTHIDGTMRFESGAIGSLTTSFDVYGYPYPPIVIFGTKGSIEVPDPNGFGGVVKIRREGSNEYVEVPLELPHHANLRGLGVVDMAHVIRNGGEHRASLQFALHVLDAMQGFLESGDQHVEIAMQPGTKRPTAVAPDEFPQISAR